ncbi:hypothetical protein MMC32_007378 [Xylographa parallela]|nr:hypothetical protein [Xylographa parallela]
MMVMNEYPGRISSLGVMSCLEEKFEIIKDIGDGSFGSVALARVRTAGAHVARRGTMVAIKTMKKTFDSFAQCMELREVIFLRALPIHPHLVPALDIFLDPMSHKLHICMEYMDGNLYQLMKARDHKCLDGSSVKSILYQILSGLEHVHNHDFFHRDIKPENILVSTSAPHESGLTFRRYSALVTPPSTPPIYTIKIADFGLARETHSTLPYTTYVSTRWYRAPEVLLRAGEYSAPVDMWAIGAMAVEIATLKPLFPGGNEVDQVWRVCEIMGSPGNWYSKSGAKVGGGDWREGTRLAEKLGFSFPKMAPHSMETILQPPHWPLALSSFVTSCLMWDPRVRPTSGQALNHEYFSDAIDPLRPRTATNRLLQRKHSVYEPKPQKQQIESPPTSTRTSWFRKSLISRESAPAVPQHSISARPLSPNPSPIHSSTIPVITISPKVRPNVNKRATWANSSTPSTGAPMPILPSIRPISPLSNAVTAQARTAVMGEPSGVPSNYALTRDEKTTKKIGRQLSVASHGNHYADMHRQDAERSLNGNGVLASPTSVQKEGFFSHLRKRARRLSGRHQTPLSPKYDDVEASAGCAPWQSNRSSVAMDQNGVPEPLQKHDFAELDRALQNVRYSLDTSLQSPHSLAGSQRSPMVNAVTTPATKRVQSLTQLSSPRPLDDLPSPISGPGPIASRTRRALQLSTHPAYRYETPDEEEELLDEALHNSQRAVRGMERRSKTDLDVSRSTLAVKDSNRPSLHHSLSSNAIINPYPTPSPSAKRNGMLFTQSLMDEPAAPLNIARSRPKQDYPNLWPTPPYEENEWAASAAASIIAAGSAYR